MKSVEPDAFLFLGAGTPWVRACAEALTRVGHTVVAVALNDWRNGRSRSATDWKETGTGAWREAVWSLPPGYAGGLQTLFAPFLRFKLRREVIELRRRHDRRLPDHPWVVVPYPWFEAFTSQVPDERLIYYHYDDYALFRPERDAAIRGQQRRIVERAELTLCSSRQQTDVLKDRHPTRADRIRHFPHGVQTRCLNPLEDKASRSHGVGYVGNLIDRVDWQLVSEVARALPEVTFTFVGNLIGAAGGGNRLDWLRERADALALPNVEHVGPVPQEKVNEFYWRFSVFWIPYATDHTFNQASCPTKIMDGLASGRPMVSTGVPECRLYPEWIAIADTAEAMTTALREALTQAGSAERARAQVGFARRHTWEEQGKVLTEWCGDKAESSRHG